LSLSEAPTNGKIEFPEGLLDALQAGYFGRQMRDGISWLEEHRPAIEALDPVQKNSARIMGLLALWAEAGSCHLALVRKLFRRFPDCLTKDFSVFDFVHLRLAQGLLDIADENFDVAITRLEIINGIEAQAWLAPLVAITNYWIGKCHGRMGRYDEALRYAAKARELSLQLGHEMMAAVIRTWEAWLTFKKGKSKEATQLLQEAEKILLGTDDYTAMGNIQFVYARIARRERRYDAAVVHFTAAIAEFRRWMPPAPELARSLTNLAIVKQFIALQIQHKMDHEVGSRRRSRGRRTDRRRIESLREEAQAYLREAAEIYRISDNHHGSGTVYLSRGQVYLSSGELDRAEEEAQEAYWIGQHKNDYNLMARARVLGAMVENAKVDEQIDDDLGAHAKLASQLADEAGEWALRVPNRRVLAKTLVAKSLILSNDFFNDTESARKYAERAKALFGPTGHDYLWQDLQMLGETIHRFRGVDSVLREWSHGHVGNKTFQQIAEEFAGIVIPKVWKLEGRKVSRVAKRLSISPKKVRRILSRQGLLRVIYPGQ